VGCQGGPIAVQVRLKENMASGEKPAVGGETYAAIKGPNDHREQIKDSGKDHQILTAGPWGQKKELAQRPYCSKIGSAWTVHGIGEGSPA